MVRKRASGAAAVGEIELTCKSGLEERSISDYDESGRRYEPDGKMNYCTQQRPFYACTFAVTYFLRAEVIRSKHSIGKHIIWKC